MSAPLVVVSCESAVSTGGLSLTLARPSGVVVGRALLALLVAPGSTSPLGLEDEGWTLLADAGIGDVHYTLAIRDVVVDEPASYSFSFLGSPGVTEVPPMGALMVIDGATGALADLDVDSFTASANPLQHPADAAATSYVDACLTFWAVNNADGFTLAATSDARTVANVSGSDGTRSGSLLVWFERVEAAGVVGAREANATTAGGNGAHGQYVLAGEAVIACTALTPMDPPGAIGLPWVGV